MPRADPLSNVVPLRPRPPAAAGGRETASLVSDLVAVIAQLRDASARSAGLARPAIEVERTVQLLLDAVTAVESAVDVATDGGALTPF